MLAIWMCTGFHYDHNIIVHHELNHVQPHIRHLAGNIQLTQITSFGNCLITI